MLPFRNIKRNLYKALQQPLYAVRVFYRRLLSYIKYKSHGGRSFPPEAITLFLTYRCNLECKMCGQWGESGVTKKDLNKTRKELSLEAWKKIVEDIAEFRPNITLFGGEPLIYKDVIELIEYIKLKKLHCIIITNGTMLEKYGKELVEVGVDEINLSIDGDEKLHDYIRGVPGLFSKISRGVELVNRYKKKKPLLNLQCTITPYNYLYLDRLVDVGKSFNADSLTFHHYIFITEELYSRQEKVTTELLKVTSFDWSGFIRNVCNLGIDGEVLCKVISRVRRLSRNNKFFANFYPNFDEKEIIEYYSSLHFISRTYPQRCLSPWIVGYIFPDGELRPCLNINYSFGNVCNQKFKEVWNNEKAVFFRRVLRKMRFFPACVRCTELYRY